MLIALREMKVGRKPKLDENGEPVLDEAGSPVLVDDIRHPGDEVPEAEDWPKLHDMLENGFLERVTKEVDILERLSVLESRLGDLVEEVGQMKVALNDQFDAKFDLTKTEEKPPTSTRKRGATKSA